MSTAKTHYKSGNLHNIAIENDHRKFVSFPIDNGNFPVRYANVDQRATTLSYQP